MGGSRVLSEASYSSEANPTNPAAVAFSVLSGMVLMGLPFGVVALRQGLLENGIFADYCPDGEDPSANGGRPCHVQLVSLSQLFAGVIVISNVLILPIGRLVDWYGSRRVLRMCLVVTGAGYALSGFGMRTGLFFTIGMSVAGAVGSGIGSAALGVILPASVPAHDLDLWSTVAGAGIDIGCALAVPLGFLIQWSALPVWAWFAIVAALLMAVFLPLHTVAVTHLRQHPPHAVLPIMTLIKDPQMLKRMYFFTVMTSFTTAVEAASGRLITSYGSEDSVKTIVYVPLAVALAAFVVSSVIAATGNDHVKVGFPLRCGCLVFVCVALCASGLRDIAAFWFLILAMSGYRALSLQLITRSLYGTVTPGNEGTAFGALFTIGGLLSIGPSQLVTYLLPHSEVALLAATAVMAGMCFFGDILVTHLLAAAGGGGGGSHEEVEPRRRDDTNEGTPLVEKL